VSNGAIALDAVAQRDTELQQLIVEGDRLLAATAARNREITRTVFVPDRLLNVVVR